MTNLAGLKVLVVDDELDARDLLQRILEECGAIVDAAGSAAEALTLLKSEQPHVLVSDVGMPGVDGYAFLASVRDLEPKDGGSIPAVALTAFARSEDRVRALQAGFQAHLPKPVDPSELVVTIATVADRLSERRE
jgi:CheY-like chemotaxis protein